jgi:AAA+ superfamily predicted ATPase
MAEVNLNIDDLKGFMNHIVSNNRFLQESGKLPVSVEVLGESGIGKTSTVKDIADDMDLDFVKLNLAQIEELGDLVGFPVRQFQLYKEKEVKQKTSDLNYATAWSVG